MIWDEKIVLSWIYFLSNVNIQVSSNAGTLGNENGNYIHVSMREIIAFSQNSAEMTRYSHAKTVKLYPYCGSLNNVPKDTWSCSLEPVNVSLCGKRLFAGVIKDFEMWRLFGIIRVDPKGNHKCLYKGEAGGDLTRSEEYKACVP